MGEQDLQIRDSRARLGEAPDRYAEEAVQNGTGDPGLRILQAADEGIQGEEGRTYQRPRVPQVPLRARSSGTAEVYGDQLMEISFVKEVFTKYDLELLRTLCEERRGLHSNYIYPRREKQSVKKCIRLLDETLSKLGKKE